MKSQAVESHRPPHAEILASVIEDHGVTLRKGAVKAVAYRAPLNIIAAVDALCQISKLSRNEILSELLTVGLEEVGKQLVPKTSKMFENLRHEIYGVYSDQAEEQQ